MPEQATVVMAPPAARGQRRVDRWFYISSGLFAISLAVVGFGPSIIDQSRRNAALTPAVTAHGMVAGAWLLLFVTQATLIATRRTEVHRRVGMIGPVLAAMLIALGYLMLVEGSRRGYELSGDLTRAVTPPGSPPQNPDDFTAGVLIPLSNFFAFGVLVAAGLLYRHRPAIHKRLMLLALFPLADEPIIHLVGHLAGRWPTLQGAGLFVFPIQLSLMFASAIYDKVSSGRIHPVSLWVPILLLAWGTVIRAVLPSVTWHELAVWWFR